MKYHTNTGDTTNTTMKIPNRKKNDRACFWSMPTNMYHQTHKKLRYTFRKSEPLISMLESLKRETLRTS